MKVRYLVLIVMTFSQSLILSSEGDYLDDSVLVRQPAGFCIQIRMPGSDVLSDVCIYDDMDQFDIKDAVIDALYLDDTDRYLKAPGSEPVMIADREIVPFDENMKSFLRDRYESGSVDQIIVTLR